jgi:acetylglutamate kinase
MEIIIQLLALEFVQLLAQMAITETLQLIYVYQDVLINILASALMADRACKLALMAIMPPTLQLIGFALLYVMLDIGPIT